MKLGIFTIVLDGMPFIQHHLRTFDKLPFDWRWCVAEGASMNGADTRWCQPQEPRHSEDGTLEYLCNINSHPGLALVTQKDWPSKTHMCNAALEKLFDCDVLLEVDVDEFHSVQNITTIVKLFQTDPNLAVIRMPCRYFVGPDLVCEGEGCWSNRASEWVRAWRFNPSYKFTTHEPPSLWRGSEFPNGKIMTRKQSQSIGLCFDHFAYATLKQVTYKEKFYGYKGLVNQWKALQNFRDFPVQLNQFFPFVDPIVTVNRLDRRDIPEILRACS